MNFLLKKTADLPGDATGTHCHTRRDHTETGKNIAVLGNVWGCNPGFTIGFMRFQGRE